MNEPASILIAVFCCLHCVPVNFLTVKVSRFCDCVDFPVKVSRRDKTVHGESTCPNSVAVHNRVFWSLSAEAVVCNTLAFAFEQFRPVGGEDKIVETVVFPVVWKAVRLVLVGFEMVRFPAPDDFQLKHLRILNLDLPHKDSVLFSLIWFNRD